MTAKEFLSQAYVLDQRIQAKMRQIADLRALASTVNGFASNEPVVQTRDVTGLQSAVARIIEEEQVLNEEIDALVEARQQIREVIDRLPDPMMCLILERRYLLFENWEKISADLTYSERWIYERHRQALELVEGILNDAA